jgi:hypothetical protein
MSILHYFSLYMVEYNVKFAPYQERVRENVDRDAT